MCLPLRLHGVGSCNHLIPCVNQAKARKSIYLCFSTLSISFCVNHKTPLDKSIFIS